jgi:prolyl-tRNA editing enzyme YbaK/EbsC (Cys-tRNA(Pro) deacylase)
VVTTARAGKESTVRDRLEAVRRSGVRGALEVHRELLARDVPHEVVRLPVRLASADDLPGALGLELGCVAVRCYLVERSGRCSFAAVLVPAGAVPSPAALLDALSARSVRPARPEQVNATTDCTAGLVSPVGLPPEVEVVADEALLRSPTSYCALGEGGVALGIRTGDLLEVTGARTAPLTAGADQPDEGHPRTIDLDPPRAVRRAP